MHICSSPSPAVALWGLADLLGQSDMNGGIYNLVMDSSEDDACPPPFLKVFSFS